MSHFEEFYNSYASSLWISRLCDLYSIGRKMTGVSELPLLHKYVIRPQDDLQLVMTKLNYRLCVKQVSQVNYRRSLGESISEAVDLCELAPITHPCTATMSNTQLMTPQVEPLVFGEDSECLSSPKLLSPSDSSYCGTMKSDDSGIVMDDSHNFSMSSSDHERDGELNFTSSEVSPLEEENYFVQATKMEVSVSAHSESSVDESPVRVVDFNNKHETHQAVEEFFRNSVNVDEGVQDINNEDITHDDSAEQPREDMAHDDSAEQPREDITHDDSAEQPREDITHNHMSPNSQQLSTLESEHEDLPQHDDITHLQQTDTVSQQPDDQSEPTGQSEQETESMLTNDEETLEIPAVVEELIEKEAVEKEFEEIRIEVPQLAPPQEDERVDFVKEEEPEETLFDPGLRCNDAYTALDILKTKYRLSDATVIRKFIITFSSWNVSQLSHPMSSGNRCSWWDDDIKDEEIAEDDPQVDELMEQIYSRQGEISELVDRIMEEEADKIRAEKALVKAASKPPESAPENNTQNAPEIVPCEDVITPSQVPVSQGAPMNNKPTDKKKNRNALRRFMHAMRKRLRRNRAPSESNRKTT